MLYTDDRSFSSTQHSHECRQFFSQRERRLATLRERSRSRRASESPEARERRLARMRARNRERRTLETAEEREVRLSCDRLRRAARLASESPQQRETRPSQARLNQDRRLASESPEDGAARLQHLSARQQERIASETPDETAARRQRDREAHSRPPAASAQPLLHQPAVQARLISQYVSCDYHQLDRSRSPKMHCIALVVHMV